MYMYRKEGGEGVKEGREEGKKEGGKGDRGGEREKGRKERTAGKEGTRLEAPFVTCRPEARSAFCVRKRKKSIYSSALVLSFEVSRL
jgi:hypothetical protein